MNKKKDEECMTMFWDSVIVNGVQDPGLTTFEEFLPRVGILKTKAQVKPGFRQNLRPAKARPNINLDLGLESGL